jgi:hypothetical protein
MAKILSNFVLSNVLRQIKLVKRDGLGSWGRMGIMVFNATFNNISVTLCWGSKEKNEHKYNKSNYNGVPFKMRNVLYLKVIWFHHVEM